jgi:isoleucyl-tRNA synthetase
MPLLSEIVMVIESQDNVDKIGSYDFERVEKTVLSFWQNSKIYEKSKDRGKNGPKFYFLQGPPYTSGRLHLGHAWNNSLKDFALRYKRMKGFNVWDRAGYDMHGLPVSLQVQKIHNIKLKEEIEGFGVEKFVQECIRYSTEGAKVMDKDLQRFGIWLDYSDPYYPIHNDFIEGEWWLIKRAEEEGRLYKGKRTMGWCASCGTALAKHEQQYKNITDNSIYVKFPVKGKQDGPQKEFIIIWTTTPWTLTFNLAVMVNPDKLYAKIRGGTNNDEVWIVASDLANEISRIASGKSKEEWGEKTATVIEEFRGEKLAGLGYEHPWSSEVDFASIKADAPKTHTVLLSKEYVDTSSGTGIVHCAPGCGPEDYEVGYRNGLPAFNEVDEHGRFSTDLGKFAGWKAKVDDKKFVEDLKEHGYLVSSVPVTHEYAHCDRCKNPLIFRATEQWFFKVEDLVPKIREHIKDVHWVPGSAGKSFDLWFENLRDNSITRQLYWGTPVPIWECSECSKYEVIGSIEEMEEKGMKVPENLHRPWIDEATFVCGCGGTYKRVPDVLDVWIDAGSVSWNCLYYPQRKDLMEKFWPVDFILEASEQINLWFYKLMANSMITKGEPCFKNVYLTGMLNGVDGVKMSKSLGNIISPYELVDKYGTDTMRTYLCSIPAGRNINFSWNEIETRYRNLSVLWNLHKYLIDVADFYGINPRTLGTLEEERLEEEEKFILSRTYSVLKTVTEHLEKYELDNVPKMIEDLYLSISRVYVQLVRDKASHSGSGSSVVIYVLYQVLMETLKMYSLVCPFITEMIYQNFKEAFELKTESVHLLAWTDLGDAEGKAKYIAPKLEREMEVAGEVIQSILAAREKVQISRRWPIKEVIIETSDELVRRAVEALEEIILKQTNVKLIKIKSSFASVELEIRPNFTAIKESFENNSGTLISLINQKQPELNKIYAEIESKGSFVLQSDEDSFKLEAKHFMVQRKVPYPFKESSFGAGMVYLNQERTPELDLEGYVRELTRRVQALRKEADLSKSDRINLSLAVPEPLVSGFQKWEAEIVDKTGTSKLILVSNEDLGNLKFKGTLDVKKNKFEFGFNVC